jgi:ankyrin repeat protein
MHRAAATGPAPVRRLAAAIAASTEALDDLLQAGASPAGAGLLALALSRLNGAAQGAALPLNLLERGADPFGPDARDRTPLHLAVVNGSPSCCRRCWRAAAIRTRAIATAARRLFAALEHGAQALPLVRALIAHGANPEAADANGETPLGLALDTRPWSAGWTGATGRDRTARCAPTICRQRPRRRTRHGAATAGTGFRRGYPRRSRRLRAAARLRCGPSRGRRLPARCRRRCVARRTQRRDAAGRGGRRTARSAGRLAAGTQGRHRSAVAQRHHRADGGRRDGLSGNRRALLDAGADVNAVDAGGRSALHAAAQFGFEHNDSLRARRLFDGLLKHGADINQADSEGKTPLLLLLGAQLRPGSDCDATHIGALVPLLLDAGAKVEHADQRGVTALHACAMHALLPPARVLLSRGADRHAVDAFGRTAADVARQLGYVDIAHELDGAQRRDSQRAADLRQPAQPAD